VPFHSTNEGLDKAVDDVAGSIGVALAVGKSKRGHWKFIDGLKCLVLSSGNAWMARENCFPLADKHSSRASQAFFRGILSQCPFT
jgi:hypothetical protein